MSATNPDQVVYGIMAQTVASLPTAMRKKVQRAVTELRQIVEAHDIEGAIALAFLGAELAAKSEEAIGCCCQRSDQPIAVSVLPHQP